VHPSYIQCGWRTKVKVVPVTIGPTGGDDEMCQGPVPRQKFRRTDRIQFLPKLGTRGETATW
jgi:hypothetical protein